MLAGRGAVRGGGCINTYITAPNPKGLIKMEIDLIFQIAGIGMIVAVLNQLLSRSGHDEQALMTTIAGLVIVLLMLVEKIGGLFETVKTVFGI